MLGLRAQEEICQRSATPGGRGKGDIPEHHATAGPTTDPSDTTRIFTRLPETFTTATWKRSTCAPQPHRHVESRRIEPIGDDVTIRTCSAGTTSSERRLWLRPEASSGTERPATADLGPWRLLAVVCLQSDA